MKKSKAKKVEDVSFPPMKILILDIETAPNLVYTWGLWKQNIPLSNIVEASKILCWSAKWLNGKEMYFSSLETDSPEKMLSKIWELLDEADVVVSYNGKKFDLPRLNNEFRKYGFPPPSPYKQVDLYLVVKSAFNLLSNKLEYVVKYFKLGEKGKTGGMELWIGCMHGDAKSWKKMGFYNKKDVSLTEKVYKHVLPWVSNHPNHGLFTGDEFGCPNCGSHKVQRRGTTTTSAHIYQRYQCMNPKCGKWSRHKSSITRDMFPDQHAGSLRNC